MHFSAATDAIDCQAIIKNDPLVFRGDQLAQITDLLMCTLQRKGGVTCWNLPVIRLIPLRKMP